MKFIYWYKKKKVISAQYQPLRQDVFWEIPIAANKSRFIRPLFFFAGLDFSHSFCNWLNDFQKSAKWKISWSKGSIETCVRADIAFRAIDVYEKWCQRCFILTANKDKTFAICDRCGRFLPNQYLCWLKTKLIWRFMVQRWIIKIELPLNERKWKCLHTNSVMVVVDKQYIAAWAI